MENVSRAVPNFRAKFADILFSKKNQACPPWPERDRSMAIGISKSQHVSRKVEISFCHSPSSKSIAKKQQVSSWHKGYIPATKLPRPRKCSSITLSSKAAYDLCAHSAHFPAGFLHNPIFHSFKQTGEYPDVPFLLFSHRFAYTSSRPLNNAINSLIFSAGSDKLVIVGCRSNTVASLSKIGFSSGKRIVLSFEI